MGGGAVSCRSKTSGVAAGCAPARCSGRRKACGRGVGRCVECGRGEGEARYCRGSMMITGRGCHGTVVAAGAGGAVWAEALAARAARSAAAASEAESGLTSLSYRTG